MNGQINGQTGNWPKTVTRIGQTERQTSKKRGGYRTVVGYQTRTKLATWVNNRQDISLTSLNSRIAIDKAVIIYSASRTKYSCIPLVSFSFFSLCMNHRMCDYTFYLLLLQLWGLYVTQHVNVLMTEPGLWPHFLFFNTSLKSCTHLTLSDKLLRSI